MAYENENFTLSQDWKLPIPGFMVLSPKRHIEKLSELTNEERNEMFEIVNKTVIIMRNYDICDRFDYVFEEKEKRHLHIWIMPRYEWIKTIDGDIINNIGKVFDYAKSNYRSKEIYEKINYITNIINNEFNKKNLTKALRPEYDHSPSCNK